LTILLTSLSGYAFERRLMHLKERLAPSPQPATREAAGGSSPWSLSTPLSPGTHP
jgi:hypothetical protein